MALYSNRQSDEKFKQLYLNFNNKKYQQSMKCGYEQTVKLPYRNDNAQMTQFYTVEQLNKWKEKNDKENAFCKGISFKTKEMDAPYKSSTKRERKKTK